jgi:hypothetical protein
MYLTNAPMKRVKPVAMISTPLRVPKHQPTIGQKDIQPPINPSMKVVGGNGKAGAGTLFSFKG